MPDYMMPDLELNDPPSAVGRLSSNLYKIVTPPATLEHPEHVLSPVEGGRRWSGLTAPQASFDYGAEKGSAPPLRMRAPLGFIHVYADTSMRTRRYGHVDTNCDGPINVIIATDYPKDRSSEV